MHKLNGWTGRDDYRSKAELLQKELNEMQEKVCIVLFSKSSVRSVM